MDVVITCIGNMGLNASHPDALLFPVSRALCLLGKNALGMGELFFVLVGVLRVRIAVVL